MSLYMLVFFHTCNVLLLSWTLHEASAPQNAHIALAKCSTLFEVAKKKTKKMIDMTFTFQFACSP